MKKVFYILISIVSVDLVFDGEQLSKLPVLIHHYAEHQHKEHIGFIDFLVSHYIKHHSNAAEHKNFPFKDHQDCSHIHFYYDSVQKIKIQIVDNDNQKFQIVQLKQSSTPSYFSVWHPPKSVA